MKIVLSLVWVALAVAFAHAGQQFATAAGAPPPAFEAASPRFSLEGEGFHFDLDMEGTPLAEPFRELEAEVQAYLREVAAARRRANRRATWICTGGALASLAGLALVWRRAPGRA